ncbi:MAG: helix-turn-helix transcriptional regulator [Verrucomicrobiae bacterium]
MTNSPQALGTVLKEFRAQAKFSQRQLADKSGVPYSLISALENGRRTAGNRIAGKLVDALHLVGKDRAQFLTLAKLTSKRIRLSVAEESEKEVPSAWLKFLKFLVPEWEIAEISFPKSGIYDLLLTKSDRWICGVIFRSGLTLLVWNPGLEGGLADTHALRALIEEATTQRKTKKDFHSIAEKGRASGYEIRFFGDFLGSQE